MDIHTRLIILGLRLGATFLMILTAALLWRVMLWLPWQADCLIAGAAALAFAYRFERQEAR